MTIIAAMFVAAVFLLAAVVGGLIMPSVLPMIGLCLVAFIVAVCAGIVADRIVSGRRARGPRRRP
jgi:hypothetical protein